MSYNYTSTKLSYKEQLISLQSHMVLTTGYRNIDIDNT